MLRHVNSEETNKYWKHSYNCIRKFYPENHILIIDDNSNCEYITNISLYKTIIIYSEYHKRAELLPYYYYLQFKLFDKAVILHDSVFINQYIDFNVDKYMPLWHFKHDWDLIDEETKMLHLFNDQDILKFYENKTLWNGCFGGMSIITHDYLKFVNSKYDLNKLLNCVTDRVYRMAFERVIDCLMQKDCKTNSFLGDIHEYCHWGIKFEEIDNYKYLPLIKVWTCR
jgi:hypothetical protein